MTFLRLSTTQCFICDRTIGSQIDSAQLQYASPDDVGVIARNGRAWVHRECWKTWPSRGAWARSSAKLLESGENVVSRRGVLARDSALGNVLFTDVDPPFEWRVPREVLPELREAFRASEPSIVEFDHSIWTVTPEEGHLRLIATHDGEQFCDVELQDVLARMDVLEEVSSIAQ